MRKYNGARRGPAIYEYNVRSSCAAAVRCSSGKDADFLSIGESRSSPSNLGDAGRPGCSSAILLGRKRNRHCARNARTFALCHRSFPARYAAPKRRAVSSAGASRSCLIEGHKSRENRGRGGQILILGMIKESAERGTRKWLAHESLVHAQFFWAAFVIPRFLL